MDTTNQNSAEGRGETEKTYLFHQRGPTISNLRYGRKISTKRKCMVMVSCVMQLCICNGVGYGLSVMYAELVEVFDTKRANAAFVQSLNMGLSTGAGIVFTGTIKRFGLGPCIIVGSIVSTVGLLVSSLAEDIVMIILCTGVVAGVAMGVNYLTPFIIVSQLFQENASLFLITLTIGTSFGQFLGPLLFELFIQLYTWSGAFLMFAGISLNCVPFGIIVYFTYKHLSTEEVVDQASSTNSNVFCVPALFTDGIVWTLWINLLLLALTGNFEVFMIVDHAVTLGFHREVGSVLVSTIGFGNFVGRLFGAFLRFRVQLPTISHWTYLLILAAVVHAVIVQLYTFWLLIVSCAICGILLGTMAGQAPAVMFEVSGPEIYPQAMSIVNVMYGIAETVGPLIGGFIRDRTGAYNMAFYIASATSLYIWLSNTGIILALRRRNSRLTE